MKEQRLIQIAELLIGVSYSDWTRIRTCIEKSYDSAINRVELSDAESLKIFLKQEIITE